MQIIEYNDNIQKLIILPTDKDNEILYIKTLDIVNGQFDSQINSIYIENCNGFQSFIHNPNTGDTYMSINTGISKYYIRKFDKEF